MIVQLELTSRCISKCPACILHRSKLWTAPIDLNFESFKISFKDVLLNITRFIFCGTKGEILYYHKLIELLEFIAMYNSNIKIELHTIAQREDKQFWKSLVNVLHKFKSVLIVISLDGLQDTYDKYRINCSFNVALNNALYLIKSNFSVVWSFIKFPHNIHQLSICKQLSKTLGFAGFVEKDAWDIDVPNYSYMKTSIYKTHPRLNKQTCYANDVHSYTLTCDGYVWPCCTIVNMYVKKTLDVDPKDRLFMIDEFNIHNDTFYNIVTSTLWCANLSKLLQSGFCNEFLCEYLKQEV